jgi:hypothetical protein
VRKIIAAAAAVFLFGTVSGARAHDGPHTGPDDATLKVGKVTRTAIMAKEMANRTLVVTMIQVAGEDFDHLPEAAVSATR